MNYIKKLKLGSKVYIGFGLICTILLFSVLFALSGLTEISNDFARYRQISTEEMLVGRIRANLLEMRLAFENYVQLKDDKHREFFEESHKRMEGYILELRNSMDSSERQEVLGQILMRTYEYKKSFEKLVEYKARRDIYYNELIKYGPMMEGSLSTIMDLAREQGSGSLSYGAGYAMKHLLLGRLHVSRFLELNDPSMVEHVRVNLDEMSKWIVFLEEAAVNGAERKLLGEIKENSDIYYNSFVDISVNIAEQNLIVEHMDSLGPEISSLADSIEKMIVSEQSTYGPKAKEANQSILIRMFILSVLAIISSIIISVGIVKIVVEPVRAVTNIFRDVSAEEADLDFRLKVSSRDELGEMAAYFNKFMEKLKQILKQNKDYGWVKAGHAELNEKIHVEDNIKGLCQSIAVFVSRYVNAGIGAVYIKDEDSIYRLQGSFAFDAANASAKMIRPGEGLVGQAFLEGQMILVNDVPEDYLKIKSGLGEGPPKHLVYVPCKLTNEVLGVIELGSFREFTDVQLEFLREISESTAIAISSVSSRHQLRKLLEKTIAQSEELQAQQEELRQTNEELQEQTNSLEIQKRETDKKNQKLLDAQEEIALKAEALEAASKYKSEFLANMSHELRTPLNSILVLSQLLADKKENTPVDSKQLEFAKTINMAGKDLLRLINDILDLSKVEAGKIELSFETVNLKELCQYVERTFRQVIEGKGLDFEVLVEDGAPEELITDGHRVQQIINNFLSNAVKFTEAGRITFRIGAPAADIVGDTGLQPSRAIAFTVEDTGVGIPFSKQAVIFEAFRQSDGTTSRRYGGTGLGLSIAKELARLLGGEIHLTSEEGRGSSFSLLLPKDSVEGSSLATISLEAASAVEGELVANSDPILLVIEDDEDFSKILKDIAREKCYRAISASSGREGIALANTIRPSAIILDIGLPDISGYTVIESLKGSLKTMDIPIHVFSGNELKSSYNTKGGILGYIQKPVNLDTINSAFERIERALASKVKRLLVVGFDEEEARSLTEAIDNKELDFYSAKSGKEALSLLMSESIDCIILDFRIKDITGFEFLDYVMNSTMKNVPVIIYTDDLSARDADELDKYVEAIILKGAKSMERLSAEVKLFLHRLDSDTVKGSKHIRTSLEKEEALAGKRILIIDDDMRNVFTLSSILEEKGIEVLVGKNGREGIVKLSTNEGIDLVIMDIMMPEMDGYSAIREIRSSKAHSRTPIVVLTAKAMKEDRERCIEAGANDYMTKPIDAERLLSLLKIWLYKG